MKQLRIKTLARAVQWNSINLGEVLEFYGAHKYTHDLMTGELILYKGELEVILDNDAWLIESPISKGFEVCAFLDDRYEVVE